jgi:hypothetical protein
MFTNREAKSILPTDKYISYKNIKKNLSLREWTNTSPWAGFELTTLVEISTDRTGSCKSNYHTITTTISPERNNTIVQCRLSREAGLVVSVASFFQAQCLHKCFTRNCITNENYELCFSPLLVPVFVWSRFYTGTSQEIRKKLSH